MTESNIPELEEPVALNEAYRPVEYGTIGSIQVLMATAVPRDYCNYYSANVNISQIYVEPGDTVNAGDVLAVCDVDEAKKQLQECQAALVHENETYEISAQISDTQIKLWESQAAPNIDERVADTGEFSTEQTEKNESTDEDYNKQIATEQENQRYDKQLHEYRVQKINEQMALYQQIVDDGTLKAAHSGLVTYTKKLTGGRSAAAYENIVIVSDTDDLVLDIKDTAINEYKYSDYDKKYVIVDGEKYDVTESQYTSEVLVLSKINNRYPDVCVESTALVHSLNEAYRKGGQTANPVFEAYEDIYSKLSKCGTFSVERPNNNVSVPLLTHTGDRKNPEMMFVMANINGQEVMSHFLLSI